LRKPTSPECIRPTERCSGVAATWARML
jgi:hypothetical protein